MGSWERWETVLGFLGVWTILYAVWIFTTERRFGAPAFSCQDSLYDFEQDTSMSYFPFFSALYLVMCKRVINTYLQEAS